MHSALCTWRHCSAFNVDSEPTSDHDVIDNDGDATMRWGSVAFRCNYPVLRNLHSFLGLLSAAFLY